MSKPYNHLTLIKLKYIDLQIYSDNKKLYLYYGYV